MGMAVGNSTQSAPIASEWPLESWKHTDDEIIYETTGLDYDGNVLELVTFDLLAESTTLQLEKSGFRSQQALEALLGINSFYKNTSTKQILADTRAQYMPTNVGQDEALIAELLRYAIKDSIWAPSLLQYNLLRQETYQWYQQNLSASFIQYQEGYPKYQEASNDPSFPDSRVNDPETIELPYHILAILLWIKHPTFPETSTIVLVCAIGIFLVILKVLLTHATRK